LPRKASRATWPAKDSKLAVGNLACLLACWELRRDAGLCPF